MSVQPPPAPSRTDPAPLTRTSSAGATPGPGTPPATAAAGEASPHASANASLGKLLIELGPLIVFFLANYWAGTHLPSPRDAIFWGTGAFMIATAVALIASRVLWGRIPVMPLVSGALVLVFGGLTLYLKNEVFIMVKPTILYTLFALVLFAGLARGIPLLRYALGSAVALTETGWRLLTIRWAAFFLVLAALNELVWRTTSADFWIKFKLFGFLPLTVAFAVLQTGLMKRHAAPTESNDGV